MARRFRPIDRALANSRANALPGENYVIVGTRIVKETTKPTNIEKQSLSPSGLEKR